MSSVLTSNKLIKSIKRRAMIPKDQNTFTDEDFLEMLNEEMLYFGVPHLLRTYEEYLIVSEDFPIENSNKFEIPYRALGNKLREVSLVTDPGSSEDIQELSRVSLEDLADFNGYSNSSYAENFYVENNKIVLLGDVPLNNTFVRMYYYIRPSSFVEEKRAGTITTIDRVSGIITLQTFPDNFNSSPDMDFIKYQSPNIILGFDVTPLSIDSTTRSVTFTPSDIPEDLKVGDYINNIQETIVPQLPVELHAVMTQRVAVAALESLGDQEGLASAERRLMKMEQSTNTLIDNRVEGAPQKIVNRHGALKSATISSYRNRGR